MADYYKLRLSETAVGAPQSFTGASAPDRDGARRRSSPRTACRRSAAAFGGRDHTTVLHACKRVKELQESEPRVREDYANLLRMLTG